MDATRTLVPTAAAEARVGKRDKEFVEVLRPSFRGMI